MKAGGNIKRVSSQALPNGGFTAQAPGDNLTSEVDKLKKLQEEKRRRRLLFGRRSLFSAGEEGVRDVLG